MFDSLQMHVFTAITDGLPPGMTTIDDDGQKVSRTFKLHDKPNGIPYLFYSETAGILKLRLSIPKFLFGNNVQELTTTEIEAFWTKLEQYLTERYNIIIPREQWIVEEIDACKNVKLESQELVQHYIEEIHKKHVPYLKPRLYSRNQTVEFSNSDRSRRIKFYDKQAQLRTDKKSEYLIDQATGILRLEITPSYNDLRTYTKQRRAVDILTARFFDYIQDKNNVSQLLNIEPMRKPSIDKLKQMRPEERMKMLEFMFLQEHYTESEIKELMSSSTIKRRRTAIADSFDKLKTSTVKPDTVSPLTLFGGGVITVSGGVVVTTVCQVFEWPNDSQSSSKKKAGHPAVPRCRSWSASTLWTCPSSMTSLFCGAAA